MKVIVSFIEDNGNPDYPITRHIYPLSDPARTVHVTPVNSGFGYDTIIVNIPRPIPKRMVKKEGWVSTRFISANEPVVADPGRVKVVYEIEEPGRQMIIHFGIFKGKNIRDLPVSYLQWLTNSDLYNALWGDPWQTDGFVVPGDVELAAREELINRGYVRHGMHWEKK